MFGGHWQGSLPTVPRKRTRVVKVLFRFNFYSHIDTLHDAEFVENFFRISYVNCVYTYIFSYIIKKNLTILLFLKLSMDSNINFIVTCN